MWTTLSVFLLIFLRLPSTFFLCVSYAAVVAAGGGASSYSLECPVHTFWLHKNVFNRNPNNIVRKLWQRSQRKPVRIVARFLFENLIMKNNRVSWSLTFIFPFSFALKFNSIQFSCSRSSCCVVVCDALDTFSLRFLFAPVFFLVLARCIYKYCVFARAPNTCNQLRFAGSVAIATADYQQLLSYASKSI